MAFKAKDLHFEKQEPAFLRRLRGEYSGDRHNVSIARPSKPRLELGDDDGPTIVDSEGHHLTREEYETLRQRETVSTPEEQSTTKTENDNDDPMHNKETPEPKDHPQKAKSTTIGASNKRRKAQIIGAGEDEDKDDEVEVARRITSVRSVKHITSKSKSKKKKIKLSFDDEGT